MRPATRPRSIGKAGRIPAGKEEHPVIFVNRMDVDAYLRWQTAQEGRIYRLPTSVEFEYAARGGLTGKNYPWGDDEPEGRANYDAGGSRRFDRWQDYLQPARWGLKNGYGLYGMAGNVWQMAVDNHDPGDGALQVPDHRSGRDRKRRAGRLVGEDQELPQMWLRGWASPPAFAIRTSAFARCASRRGATGRCRAASSPPSRSATARRSKLGSARIGQPLDSVPRLPGRGTKPRGFPRQQGAVSESTTFVDSGLKEGRRYQYYVRPVDKAGNEGRRSEWAGVTTTGARLCDHRDVRAAVQAGRRSCRSSATSMATGPWTASSGWTTAISEMSQDPGLPVQLEAFTSYGRSLWRKDLCYHDHCYGSANNVPFNVWDMDRRRQSRGHHPAPDRRRGVRGHPRRHDRRR